MEQNLVRIILVAEAESMHAGAVLAERVSRSVPLGLTVESIMVERDPRLVGSVDPPGAEVEEE